MNTVIIGCGAIASRWLRTLSADPRVRVTAFVDPDATAAQRLDLRHPGVATRWFPDLAAALAAVDAEVAVNLTPPALHAAVSRSALAAGLHVLSEKPLATSLADASMLAGMAAERGLLLAVMRNRARDGQFLQFRDLLRQATEGPLMVTGDVLVSLPDPGFRSKTSLPVTTDLAVHAFDQLSELVPAPAVQVCCTETPIGFVGPHGGLATMIVTFADGSLASYRVGYTGPQLRTPANGIWRVEAHEFAARWDGAGTVTACAGRQDSDRPIHLLDTPPGYRLCIDAMVDALHAGTAAPPPLAPIALLDAALTSARTGRPAPVAPAWERS